MPVHGFYKPLETSEEMVRKKSALGKVPKGGPEAIERAKRGLWLYAFCKSLSELAIFARCQLWRSAVSGQQSVVSRARAAQEFSRKADRASG
jgi:hypothetical protein